MTETRTAQDWDERYRRGEHPWDARRAEPRLTELVPGLEVPLPVALDLGCGTGDNALWLARQGYRTVGIDIAATAVARAQQRAREAGLMQVRFICASILEALPVPTGAAGLALDRGCFHSLAEADRPRMARHLAAALAEGGWWLMLCGNADEPRAEDVQGPPQLTARQIVEAIEPHFELHRLERARFSGNDARPTHLAWRALWRRRALE